MNLKVIIHPAEEGGLGAEFSAISGCATQGKIFNVFRENIYRAVEGCLSVDFDDIPLDKNDNIMAIAV